MTHYLYRVLPVAAALFLHFSTAKADSLTPEILRPDPINGALLYGLSDNGDWGVSCVSPGYDGFSEFAGASIYDLRTNPVKSVDLKGDAVYCAAFDVTDDGLLVVGSVDLKPAYCRFEDGKWTWHVLPVPDKSYTVQNVFTDEMMTYRLDGGEVYNVTPDGRYAVGMANCMEYINLEVGVMWDLQTGEIKKIPGVNNDNLGRLMMISADGRYVSGRGTLYDLENGSSRRIPVGLDIYAQGMSTSGKYFSGVTNRNDVPYASFWDVEKNVTTVLDDEIYADAVAWTITNDGIPYVARPYFTPYAEAYVYVDGFLYSFEEILRDVYGMDLEGLTVENTGKPFKMSADGRTMVCITDPGDCYVLRLKEDIRDAVARVDLFKNWSVNPPAGTRMTSIGSVSLTFAHEIELTDGAKEGITIVDSQGNSVAKTVTNGLNVSATNLNLRFANYPMKEGEKYSIRLAPGVIQFKGQKKVSNPEILVAYEGRSNVPVKPVKFAPEEGAALSSMSLSDNPVTVVFDNMVKINVGADGTRPTARVYIDGETDLVGVVNLDVDLITGNTLVIFPDNVIPFYKGSTYTVVVPKGVVTDMAGDGPNEAFSITYQGSLVPQLGDDKYLFRSSCDDYTNFLFYEGDYGYPTYEYRQMGFEPDTTPWKVVKDDDPLDTDQCFGSHSSYTPLVKADDWVTTRQLLLPADSKPYLAFDSQSHRKMAMDTLKVIVYEYDPLLNNLNAERVADIRKNGKIVYNERQSPGAQENVIKGEWTHNVIDLTEFAGKAVYICWLNENYNGSMVMIDNIEVVNDLSAFITLRNQTNVVSQEDIVIRGMVSIEGETTRYSGIEMTLKDGEGNAVSTIKESGLDLTMGEVYNFEFPEALPLEVGVVNPFTIEYTLDEDRFAYSGRIADLTFEPETRVVIEEFTGRTCVFCPGGIVTLDHLRQLYGDKVIPVALHCYEGADPKGRNVMGYASYLGMGAAPRARVNRGPESSPLRQTPTGYANTGEGEEKLWKDYVIEALGTPALVDVAVVEKEHTLSTLEYKAYFKSAITLSDVHYRVFGVLLEDDVDDFQSNAYSTQSDPLLGEWGAGGLYGANTVRYRFEDVAREVWGTGYSGTPGLLPSEWGADEVYGVEISVPVPAVVENTANCKLVVMLIDDSTGRVVNAGRSDIELAGIDTPAVEPAEEGDPVYYDLTGRRVLNPEKGQLLIERRGSKATKIIK